MTFASIAALSAIVLLNVAASLAAYRSFSLSFGQRLFQHALIWLIPLVGAVISLVFVRLASRDPFAPEEAPRKHGGDGVYHDTDGSIPGAGSD